MGGGVHRLPKCTVIVLIWFPWVSLQTRARSGKIKEITERENSSAQSQLFSRPYRGTSSWVCAPRVSDSGTCRNPVLCDGVPAVPCLCWERRWKSMSLSRPSKCINVGKLKAAGFCTLATSVPCFMPCPVPLQRGSLTMLWPCGDAVLPEMSCVTDQPCHKGSGISLILLFSVGSGTLVFLNKTNIAT